MAGAIHCRCTGNEGRMEATELAEYKNDGKDMTWEARNVMRGQDITEAEEYGWSNTLVLQRERGTNGNDRISRV